MLENIAGNVVGNSTPTEILAAANKVAVDSISTKAGVLYNVSDELAKTGNDRNGYLLSLAISIGLYEIYQRADDDQIPEKVIKNYNDSFKSLDEIARGKEVLDLPPKVQDTNAGNGNNSNGEEVSTSGTGLRRIGSAKKRTHYI